MNKFSKFITFGRDKLDKIEKNGVVYKINCKKGAFHTLVKSVLVGKVYK